MVMAMQSANDGTAGQGVIDIVDVEDKDWAHVTQCQQVGQGNCAAAAPVGCTATCRMAKSSHKQGLMRLRP